MDVRDWLKVLEKLGAIKMGHYVYNAGDHGEKYIVKDEALIWVHLSDDMVTDLLHEFGDTNFPIDATCGPLTGGALLARDAARIINQGHLNGPESSEIPCIVAKKNSDGIMVLRGGNQGQILKGKRVLIFDDISTTGDTLLKTIAAVLAVGGIVIGVVLIANRSGGKVTADSLGLDKDCPLISLVNVDFETYPEDGCKLCIAGVPVNKDFGHGAKFLSKKKNAD